VLGKLRQLITLLKGVKELGNKYTIGNNDDLSIFKNKFNTDNGITTQPVTTNTEQQTQVTGQKKFTIGDNTDLDKFKAKFNQPQNKGTYSDAIEAQRLSVASPVSKANTQPIQTVKPVTNGMPSKAEEYETRVNYAPVPATVPQMSYADFKKQEYDIPDIIAGKKAVTPYSNRGRYIASNTPVAYVPENDINKPDLGKAIKDFGNLTNQSFALGVQDTKLGAVKAGELIGKNVLQNERLGGYTIDNSMNKNVKEAPKYNDLNARVKQIIGDKADKIIKPIEADIDKKELAMGDLKGLKSIYSGAVRSIPTTLAGAAAGAINPALGAATFGTVAGGNYAREAEIDGATEDEQLLYGIVGGVGEGLSEMIALNKFIDLAKDSGAGNLLKKGALNFIKRIAELGGTEAVQEMAIEPYANIAKKIIYDQDMPASEIVNGAEIFKSGATGFTMGLIMSAMGLPVNSISRRIIEAKIKKGENLNTVDSKTLEAAYETDTKNISEDKQQGKIIDAEFNYALSQVMAGKNIPAALEAKYPVLVEFRNNLQTEGKEVQSELPQEPVSNQNAEVGQTIEQQEKDNSKALLENEEKPVVEEPTIENKIEEENPKVKTEKVVEDAIDNIDTKYIKDKLESGQGISEGLKNVIDKIEAQEPTPNTTQELLTEEKPNDVKTIIEGDKQAQKEDNKISYGRTGKAMFEKWGNNERIVADLDKPNDPYTKAYTDFFEFYYNKGFKGEPSPMYNEKFPVGKHNFPPFLEDVFYEAGVQDLEGKTKRENKKKESDEKPAESAKSLNDYGLSVVKTKTNNGNDVWQVPSNDNTKEYVPIFHKLKARWYKPHPKAKGVWSFNYDPTEALLKELAGIEGSNTSSNVENEPAKENISISQNSEYNKGKTEEENIKGGEDDVEQGLLEGQNDGLSGGLEGRRTTEGERKTEEPKPADTSGGTGGRSEEAGTRTSGNSEGAKPDNKVLEEISRPDNASGESELPVLDSEHSDRDSLGSDISNDLNYRFTDTELDSKKPNYEDNFKALTVLKEIEKTDRAATVEEQEDLSRYKGWGGLKSVFAETKEAGTDNYTGLRIC
jgi:hypothetical protein